MPDLAMGYCRNCEAERELVLTVPWQTDHCPVCGSTEVERAG